MKTWAWLSSRLVIDRSREFCVMDTELMSTFVHFTKKKNQYLTPVKGQHLLWLLSGSVT